MKDKLRRLRGLISDNLGRGSSEPKSDEGTILSLVGSVESSSRGAILLDRGLRVEGLGLESVTFWIPERSHGDLVVQIKNATRILERLSLKLPFVSKILHCVDSVAAISGEKGLIEAFSSPLAPGFMVLNANCHPVVIAEQILHEGVHSWLNCQFLTEADDSLGWASKSGCFSPFTESPRNIERTVHGIFSYHAVLLYWTHLGCHNDIEALGLFGVGNADIERRIAVLNQQLFKAGRMLRCAVTSDATKSIARLFQKLFDCEFPYMRMPQSRASRPEANQSPRLILGICREFGLTRTEILEILLAAAGFKTSRIAVKLRHAYPLAERLISHVDVVNSSFAVVHSPGDPSAYGFVQKEGSRVSILEATHGSVYLYFGLQATLAAQLDSGSADGDIGEVFGIPKCCRNFFKAHWESGDNSRGDLFAKMLSSFPSEKVAWQCNFHATLLGDSLLFHFPCSPNCRETIKLIDSRFHYLDKMFLGPVCQDFAGFEADENKLEMSRVKLAMREPFYFGTSGSYYRASCASVKVPCESRLVSTF